MSRSLHRPQKNCRSALCVATSSSSFAAADCGTFPTRVWCELVRKNSNTKRNRFSPDILPSSDEIIIFFKQLWCVSSLCKEKKLNLTQISYRILDSYHCILAIFPEIATNINPFNLFLWPRHAQRSGQHTMNRLFPYPKWHSQSGKGRFKSLHIQPY